MKKFDADNNDGAIDLEEWQQVREAAYRTRRWKSTANKKADHPVNIMTKTNDRRRPYILSAVEEDDLTQSTAYLFCIITQLCLYYAAVSPPG